MTCIVGFKKGDKVIIGGDSAGSSGNHVRIRKDEKVFKIGKFVFGATTSFRMIQLIRYSFKPPVFSSSVGFKSDDGETDLFRYMCTSFIDSLRICLKAGGFLKTNMGEESAGQLLIAYGDRLFAIENDLQVSELMDDFNSIGAGSDYAIAAMKALSENTELQAEDIALKALEISAYYCPIVRAPFNFVST